eukprot:s5508_g2.t1
MADDARGKSQRLHTLMPSAPERVHDVAAIVDETSTSFALIPSYFHGRHGLIVDDAMFAAYPWEICFAQHQPKHQPFQFQGLPGSMDGFGAPLCASWGSSG